MAYHKATFTGLNNILDAYDAINQDGKFYYSVWLSDRDIAFQWTGDDYLKGRQFLENNLGAMEQAKNSDLLYLKFHPGKMKPGSYIERKTPVISTTPFRLCDLEDTGEIVTGYPGPANGNVSMNYRMFEAINNLKELPNVMATQLQALNDRITLIETAEFEPIEPEQSQAEKIIGVINGVASNPQIMGLIQGLFTLLKPNNIPMQTNTIAGVTETETKPEPVQIGPVNEIKFQEAIDRLHPHLKLDDDLLLLAELAETNPAMFAMLLSQLRATKK